MPLTNLQVHLDSIEETLNELRSPNDIDTVNAKLDNTLSSIGPINCDMVQDESIRIRAYEIWRRLFRPKQLGNTSSLLTTSNSTKMLFINHGFFLDIGSNEERNILFLAYSTLNKFFLNTLLEKIRLTALHQKIMSSTYKNKNIIEHILQHLQARVDEIIDANYNDLELKKGTIHKTKQGVSFAIVIVLATQDFVTAETYKKYISQVEALSEHLNTVHPPVGRGRKSSKSCGITSSNKVPPRVKDPLHEDEEDSTTPRIDHKRLRNDSEDTMLSESLTTGEISPAAKQAQLYQHAITHSGEQHPTLSEEAKQQNWRFYAFDLSRQVESTSLEDTMDIEEQANPMLLPEEHRILPEIPTYHAMNPLLFCMHRGIPEIPAMVLDQILEKEDCISPRI